MKLSTWTAICFGLVLAWNAPAWAYLDGASGSMIVQALIGGIAGMGILIKMFWQSILAKLGLRKPEEVAEDTQEDTPDTEQPEA